MGDCGTGTKDEGNTPGKADLADSESETRGGDLVATLTSTTCCTRNWVRGSPLSLFVSFRFHFPHLHNPRIYCTSFFFRSSRRPRIIPDCCQLAAAALDPP